MRDFRAWTSVAGLLLAAATAMSGHVFILPGWLWALVAVGCAFWIAWRAERQLFDDKRSEIKCDMSLAELLGRIVGDELMIDPENKKFTSETLTNLIKR